MVCLLVTEVKCSQTVIGLLILMSILDAILELTIHDEYLKIKQF